MKRKRLKPKEPPKRPAAPPELTFDEVRLTIKTAINPERERRGLPPITADEASEVVRLLNEFWGGLPGKSS